MSREAELLGLFEGLWRTPRVRFYAPERSPSNRFEDGLEAVPRSFRLSHDPTLEFNFATRLLHRRLPYATVSSGSAAKMAAKKTPVDVDGSISLPPLNLSDRLAPKRGAQEFAPFLAQLGSKETGRQSL